MTFFLRPQNASLANCSSATPNIPKTCLSQTDEEAAAASVSDYLDGSTDEEIDNDSESTHREPRRVPISAFAAPSKSAPASVPTLTINLAAASSSNSQNQNHRRQRPSSTKSIKNRGRSSPGKSRKGNGGVTYLPSEGGAVDARAAAWEAAAAAANNAVVAGGATILTESGGGGAGGVSGGAERSDMVTDASPSVSNGMKCMLA